MDDLLEFLLELVFDGVIEGATSKKVPLPVRIVLAAVIVLVAGGICVFLFVLGILEKNPWVIAISVALFLFFAIGAAVKIHKFRN